MLCVVILKHEESTEDVDDVDDINAADCLGQIHVDRLNSLKRNDNF